MRSLSLALATSLVLSISSAAAAADGGLDASLDADTDASPDAASDAASEDAAVADASDANVSKDVNQIEVGTTPSDDGAVPPGDDAGTGTTGGCSCEIAGARSPSSPLVAQSLGAIAGVLAIAGAVARYRRRRP